MNENIKNQLIWTGIWVSLPVFIALLCQIVVSLNTLYEPVRWSAVPHLTLFAGAFSWLSFSAGQESTNNQKKR